MRLFLLTTVVFLVGCSNAVDDQTSTQAVLESRFQNSWGTAYDGSYEKGWSLVVAEGEMVEFNVEFEYSYHADEVILGRRSHQLCDSYIATAGTYNLSVKIKRQSVDCELVDENNQQLNVDRIQPEFEYLAFRHFDNTVSPSDPRWAHYNMLRVTAAETGYDADDGSIAKFETLDKNYASFELWVQANRKKL